MDEQAANQAVVSLVDQHRARCLWFLRPDFYPSTREERLRVLLYIEQRGDLEAFRQAASLRQWFSRHSSATSADEAQVRLGHDQVRVEWARDSAFRFFPLQSHSDFGLVLHPFDLATNKVLALVGRLEVRDWVDVIASDERLQPLGYLAWAACAKDPAFGPASILAGAARSGRYSAEEVGQLSYSESPPDAAELARTWHRMLDEAREIVTLLPPDQAGTCVLAAAGGLFRGALTELGNALRLGGIAFHRGRLGGALPRVVG